MSAANSKLESIVFYGNELKHASDETKNMLDAYVEKIPSNQFSVNELDLSKCKLTTSTFESIVGLLTFVNEINLAVNKLSANALYPIIKVGCNLLNALEN